MGTLLMRYGLPLALGILGVLVGLGAVHVYVDHQTLHQVVTYLNAQEAERAKASGH